MVITSSGSVLSPNKLPPTSWVLEKLGLGRLVRIAALSNPDNQAGAGMLIAIDASVDQRKVLAAGALSGATLLLLNKKPGKRNSAIAQITRAIHKFPGKLQSLHIITEGSPGKLHFSNGDLTTENLHLYAEQIESWFSYQPLRPGSNIRIKNPKSFISLYAGNLASGENGHQFLENFHYLTGVSIHASQGKVGSPASNGSWQLEVALPLPRPAKFPFTNNLLETYEAVL